MFKYPQSSEGRPPNGQAKPGLVCVDFDGIYKRNNRSVFVVFSGLEIAGNRFRSPDFPWGHPSILVQAGWRDLDRDVLASAGGILSFSEGKPEPGGALVFHHADEPDQSAGL